VSNFEDIEIVFFVYLQKLHLQTLFFYNFAKKALEISKENLVKKIWPQLCNIFKNNLTDYLQHNLAQMAENRLTTRLNFFKKYDKCQECA